MQKRELHDFVGDASLNNDLQVQCSWICLLSYLKVYWITLIKLFNQKWNHNIFIIVPDTNNVFFIDTFIQNNEIWIYWRSRVFYETFKRVFYYLLLHYFQQNPSIIHENLRPVFKIINSTRSAKESYITFLDMTCVASETYLLQTISKGPSNQKQSVLVFLIRLPRRLD